MIVLSGRVKPLRCELACGYCGLPFKILRVRDVGNDVCEKVLRRYSSEHRKFEQLYYNLPLAKKGSRLLVSRR